MVAPVRSGGGMRMKVLEAIARQKAVVTTGLGAEGFAGLEPELPFLVADDRRASRPRSPSCSATTAGGGTSAASAREFAERHHSPGRLGGAAGAVYEEACAR